MKFSRPYPVDEFRTAMSYVVKGAYFIPAVREGRWDGHVSMLKNHKISTGLYRSIRKTLQNNFDVRFDEDIVFADPPPLMEGKTSDRYYQNDCVAAMIKSMVRGGGTVTAATSSGKCLGKGTPVLLFSGQIVPVETIRVGDLLMGPDSTPRRVLSLARGREEMFTITPVKGDPYTVNKSHILSLRRTRRYEGDPRAGEIVDISVTDYLASSKYNRHVLKGWKPAGIKFPKRVKTNLINPYWLGVWLGDGKAVSTQVFKPDTEIGQACFGEALRWGIGCRHVKPTNRCASWVITDGRGKGSNPLLQELRRLNLLQNKHVPDSYKLGSMFTRLQVLAGLLDTDGSLSGGRRYDFISVTKQLAYDVVFLAQSVGLHATVSPCRKGCQNGFVGDYHRVYISGDIHKIPCRIPRKKAVKQPLRTNPLNAAITVESIGMGDYYGFEIDGDRRFLLGDFTVTHNTAITGIFYSRVEGNHLFVVDQKKLMYQSQKDLSKFLGEPVGIVGDQQFQLERVTVCMVQTLAKNAKREKLMRYLGCLETITVDELHVQLNFRNFKIVDDLKPRARFGLTATLQMSDGEVWLKATSFSGPVIFNYPAEQGIKDGVLSKMRYVQLLVPPVYSPTDLKRLKSGGETVDEFVENTVEHPEKSKIIRMLTGGWLKHGRYVVILADRLKHVAYLNELLERHDPNVVKGGMKIEAIDRIIDRFERGLNRLMIASRVFNKGVSINRIDALLITSETTDANTVVQQIGRTLRLHAEKEIALIVDIGTTTGKGGHAARERFKSVKDAGLNPEVYHWAFQKARFWEAVHPRQGLKGRETPTELVLTPPSASERRKKAS